jgi:hypothetical protein
MNSVAQKSEVTWLSGGAPDCPVQQDDKALQRSTIPNPNGRADVARTGQWTVLSGAPPDCLVRPSSANFTNGYESGWGL